MGKSPYNNATSQQLKSILSRYWQLLLVGVLFIVVQWPSLANWWRVWNENDSYYSHGPLVPFMAIYMVWVNRHKFANIKFQPCWAGYLLLLASVMLFVFGNWTLSATVRAFAFVTIILGILLSMLGKRATWLLLLPVLFLLSMTPIAQSKVDTYTAKMQQQSAVVAAKILDVTGFPSELRGSTITAEGLPEPLRVAAECSGLKTLISIITFTVFLVYITTGALWKKIFLLAVAFPLSLFINSLRIAMIGYAGAITDSAEAMHKFHNNSGYLGLVICFILLFGLASLLKVRMLDPNGGAEDSNTVTENPQTANRSLPTAIVVILLLAAVYSNTHSSPIYPQTKGKIVRDNVPMKFAEWTGKELEIDKITREVLSAGDLLSRFYIDDLEIRNVHVFMTASRSSSGFHDPHICLPGGGNHIIGEHNIVIPINKPYPTKINARLLHTANDEGEALIIYWYMYGRETMSLTSDAKKRMQQLINNDLRRLITRPQDNLEISKQAEKRQFVWYRFSTQIHRDKDTDLKELESFARQFVANTKDFGNM